MVFYLVGKCKILDALFYQERLDYLSSIFFFGSYYYRVGLSINMLVMLTNPEYGFGS
jgi:hypothetical protein